MLHCGSCGGEYILDDEVSCPCGVLFCCDDCLEWHQEQECCEDY